MSSALQHFCLSGDFADQNYHRKFEFSLDVDGSGVSAEVAGDFGGGQPHRAAVQTHDAAGACVWDEIPVVSRGTEHVISHY